MPANFGADQKVALSRPSLAAATHCTANRRANEGTMATRRPDLDRPHHWRSGQRRRQPAMAAKGAAEPWGGQGCYALWARSMWAGAVRCQPGRRRSNLPQVFCQFLHPKNLEPALIPRRNLVACHADGRGFEPRRSRHEFRKQNLIRVPKSFLSSINGVRWTRMPRYAWST